MNSRRWLLALLLPVTFFLSHLTVAKTLQYVYTEDFTTTTYRNPGLTTAWWDTQQGQLRFPQFQFTEVGSCDTPSYAYRIAIAGKYAYVADLFSGLQVIDISDPAHPTLAGSYDTPGEARNIVVDEKYAYIADQTGDFRIINITNPASPVNAGSYITASFVDGVDVTGDYAFLASNASGLIILDVANPASPSLIGSYDTPGLALDVDAVGNYAFVADESNGLVVLDISNPASPTLAGHYDTPSDSWDVVVRGNYAYVADWTAGFLVIDVGDPTNPIFAGGCDTPGQAYDIDIEGDYAYVADNTIGAFQVIDISNPAQPALIQTYTTTSFVRGINIEGEYAYVANDADGLKVVKIADRLTPPMSASTFTTAGGLADFVIDGDHAFVTNGYGLRIVDISDPVSPILVGSWDSTDNVGGVAVDGDLLFLANNYAHLRIFNISDLTNPVQVGILSPLIVDYARAVRVAGDYAYVIEWPDGLRIVDITNPASPSLLGSYDTPNTAWGLEVSGNYAYVIDGGYGLRVINVINPASPIEVGGYPASETFAGMEFYGNFLFATDGGAGLKILDTRNPASLTLAGSADTPDPLDNYTDVAIAGGYAFVSDGNFKMHVFDISDPANPVFLESYATSHRCLNINVDGDFAYLATMSEGLEAVQVFQRQVDAAGNMAQSVNMFQGEILDSLRIETTQTGSILWEISSDNGMNWQTMVPGAPLEPLFIPGLSVMWRATLIRDQGGVYPTCDTLRITDEPLVIPAVFISSFYGSKSEDGVVLEWELSADEIIRGFRIYRKNTETGPGVLLNVHGLIPPANRQFIDRTTKRGMAYWYILAVVKEDYSEQISQTIKVKTDVLTLALHQNFPNPFNPSTTISFELPEKLHVNLSIFDTQGRLVKSLVDRPLTDGYKEYSWDGTDANGTPASSGVYFYRLRAGKNVQTRKMILLK